MKQKSRHVINVHTAEGAKLSLKEELVRFAKDQFAALKKKNLRLPVSIYNL